MIRRFLPLIALLAVASCNHYAHGRRKGTLADVKSPELIIYVFDGKPTISVSNTAADDACLTLDGLTAKIDGAPQRLAFAGGRDDGKTKGNVGPVNKTDFCSFARFDVWRPADFSKKTNVIEIADGTKTLRAEFPNIFAKPVWTTPPRGVSRYEPMHGVMSPPPTAGTAQYDAENFLVGSIRGSGKSADTKVAVHAGADGAVDIEIPQSLPGGLYTFYLASSERGIAPISCGFSHCVGANEFVIEAPIDIALHQAETTNE
ncbi:MAG: hypothetical protein ACRELY_01625 [Polyangiaceae bacterium]